MQKKLSGHPNIVQFITAASISKEQSDHGQAEFLLLTEFCSGESCVVRIEQIFIRPDKGKVSSADTVTELCFCEWLFSCLCLAVVL